MTDRSKAAIAAILFLSSLSLSFASGKKDAAAAGNGPAVESARRVTVAHTHSYPPYDFVDERGKSDGFEVAVLKAVDEILPEYEFSFTATADEDLLIGIESGKYALGTKGAWMTEERKKKFLFPAHYLAVSVIGIAYRAADSDRIRDFDSFAATSGKLVPISPQSAQFALVKEYNASHPDAPVALVPSDTFIINDAYQWVLEGRYDAFLDIKLSYLNSVVSETGPYHGLAGKLAYAPYKGIPTWPLFNRNETALAAAYDRAMETLKADGTLERLSNQYFGENIFLYGAE